MMISQSCNSFFHLLLGYESPIKLYEPKILTHIFCYFVQFEYFNQFSYKIYNSKFYKSVGVDNEDTKQLITTVIGSLTPTWVIYENNLSAEAVRWSFDWPTKIDLLFELSWDSFVNFISRAPLNSKMEVSHLKLTVSDINIWFSSTVI